MICVMDKSVVVIGLGNIGLRTLWNLTRRGYNALGIDSSNNAVKRARDLGLNAVLGDASSLKSITRSLGVEPRVAVTALPSIIGYSVVEEIAGEGYSVVDVSFFPEDPRTLGPIAGKHGVTIVVDTGIAPGLSNFLVGIARRELDARRAYIFVGGISRNPEPPLGIAATWSTYDLLEEYVRPARLIRGGRIVSVDPLASPRLAVEFPGIGRLEAFPTDGLRTLIYSFPDMDEMIEYTLRRPGHLDFMEGLSRLGFLDDKPLRLGGCTVSPRGCLARIIERSISSLEDLVVMKVEAEGSRGQAMYSVIVEPQDGWSAMSIATAAFQTAVTRYLLENNAPSGLVYPESFGLSSSASDAILGYAREEGLHIEMKSL